MPKKKKKKKQPPQKGANSPQNHREQAASDSEKSQDQSAGVMEYSEAPPATAAAVAGKGSDAVVPSAKTDTSQSGASPVGFVQGAKEELDKVVWPDRQQLISESAAVMLMVSFSAVLISLVDNIFQKLSQLVF